MIRCDTTPDVQMCDGNWGCFLHESARGREGGDLIAYLLCRMILWI